MNTRRRYPLETLRKHRHSQVDDRARQLAEEARKAEIAARKAQQEQDALHHHEQQTATLHQAEGDRLLQGDASAQDLIQLAMWNEARELERQQLQRKAEQAQQRKLQSEKDREQARSQLADSRAQAKTVDQHRDQHLAQIDRALQMQQEEEAAEVHNAKLVRGKK